MLDEQLVTDILRLRDQINAIQRAAHQDFEKRTKSGIDPSSLEARNAAKRFLKRLMKLEELRRKSKELALQTIRFYGIDALLPFHTNASRK